MKKVNVDDHRARAEFALQTVTQRTLSLSRRTTSSSSSSLENCVWLVWAASSAALVDVS